MCTSCPARSLERQVSGIGFKVFLPAIPSRQTPSWFTWLRAQTGATDGNLGAHLLKLEEAGYVAVAKSFVQRKPQTLYRVADAGRTARTEYVRALRQLLGSVIS